MELQSHFEDHKTVIVEELSKAVAKVIIAVAWINFKEYKSTLLDLINRKIELSIVCSDNWQNRAHLDIIEDLILKGAEIRLLTMPNTNNHMHHKFCIIDETTILNGSFNWSPNATKSFENILGIHDCALEAKKFIHEFDKLVKIETETIRELQKKHNCAQNDCNGEMFNILVFSERFTKYFEIYADLIQVCNGCDNYTAIEQCISNNSLVILLDSYRSADDEYEAEYLYDLIIAELETYANNGTVIHAIGRVRTGLDGFDEEYVQTDIIWKNKFVGIRIPDIYDDEDFDVLYDASQDL
jgi:hypothetical protein